MIAQEKSYYFLKSHIILQTVPSARVDVGMKSFQMCQHSTCTINEEWTWNLSDFESLALVLIEDSVNVKYYLQSTPSTATSNTTTEFIPMALTEFCEYVHFPVFKKYTLLKLLTLNDLNGM